MKMLTFCTFSMNDQYTIIVTDKITVTYLLVCCYRFVYDDVNISVVRNPDAGVGIEYETMEMVPASHEYETLDAYNKEYETIDFPNTQEQIARGNDNLGIASITKGSVQEEYELTQCPAYGTSRTSTQRCSSTGTPASADATVKAVRQTEDETLDATNYCD